MGRVVSVIGLGYVGLPLAVAFARKEKGASWIRALLGRPKNAVVVDIKSVFESGDFPEAAYGRL